VRSSTGGSPRKKGQLRNYTITAKDAQTYPTLSGFAKASGLEIQGIEVGYNIFENLSAPDATKPHAIYHATDINFRLKSKGKAIVAALKLPNVNDHFRGMAPDIGAIKAGDPVPVYGPRGSLNQPFYR
jgi:hypothetical protein